MHEESESGKGVGQAKKAGAKKLGDSEPDEPSKGELEVTETEQMTEDDPAERTILQ